MCVCMHWLVNIVIGFALFDRVCLEAVAMRNLVVSPAPCSMSLQRLYIHTYIYIYIYSLRFCILILSRFTCSGARGTERNNRLIKPWTNSFVLVVLFPNIGKGNARSMGHEKQCRCQPAIYIYICVCVCMDINIYIYNYHLLFPRRKSP